MKMTKFVLEGRHDRHQIHDRSDYATACMAGAGPASKIIQSPKHFQFEGNKFLCASTIALLPNIPKKKALKSYDQNSMDLVRIRCALQGWQCHGHCVRQFTFEEVYDL